MTFETAVRGYDRRQVDHFVARRLRMESALRHTLAEVENKLEQVTERASVEAAENRRLRAELAAKGTGVTEGYGARAEKLLRLAETEAAEMRAGASRESISMIEQARVTAELHRHEAEQAVIARSRELEQEARRRSRELEEREERAAEQIAGARAEADRLRAAAAEAAATMRDEAQAEATLVKARAQAEAGRTREDVRIELNRVTELRADVHSEFERLGRLIVDQLTSESGGRDPQVTGDTTKR